jgi:hypothetical protein
VLALLSGSENNSISSIESTIPVHTALVFKEQVKVKNLGLREKDLDQPQYSIQHIEGYDLICYKENIHIPQSLRKLQIVLSWCHEYLLHPGQTRTETKIDYLLRIIRGPTCGVTIVTRTTATRLIAEQLPNLNSRKRLALKPNLDPERSLWPSSVFLKNLMYLKGD